MMKRLIALILCAVTVYTTCAVSMPGSFTAKAATNSEIAAKQKALSDSQKKQQALKKQLDAVDYKKDAAEEKLELIDAQMTLTKTQISTLNDLLSDLEDDLETKNSEKDQLNQELSASFEIYKQRVRADYEEGQTTYLEVLFGSKSLSDFMTRIDILSQINEYDNKLIDDMQDKITKLNEVVKGIEKNKEDTTSAKKELTEKKSDLTAQQNESKKVIKDLNITEAQLQKQLEKEQAESERLNNQLSALMSTGTSYSGGVMAWPIPGYYTITSYFGPRNLLGMTFHYGIDVSTNRQPGKNVVAANAGRVVKVSLDSYGALYVMIDHGGGIATRYFHLSAAKVSEGANVQKGQLIALSGGAPGAYGSGLSTGPHLHFEVIVNGTRVNPLSYLGSK